jgi:peptidoglycan-associated lipoprotein
MAVPTRLPPSPSFAVLSAVFALAGCSSTTANPEVSSTAPATPSAESKTQPASAPVIAPSTSSLEVFQRGESTATPASSPLKEVYFDFDRYDLRADARETLKANGDWLKANPSVVVEIDRHCDERELNTITCHDRQRITLGHRQV